MKIVSQDYFLSIQTVRLGEANASGRMSTTLFPGCCPSPRHTHTYTHTAATISVLLIVLVVLIN